MFRSSSPALNERTFQDFGQAVPAQAASDTMTIEGTTAKTGVLLLLALVAAMFTWSGAMAAAPTAESLGQAFGAVQTWVLGGAIGGFVVALIIIFAKKTAPMLAPVYALLKGLMLGGVSAWFELVYPGIVINAVLLTMGTLGGMLFLYRSGIIKVTQRFRMGVLAATGGIMLVYLIGWIMSFFGGGIPYIHESGMIGIGFSLFVVVIAALNLVLDFDLIDAGVRHGAPKYMEWYGGFALLVTLVWLYLEMLRLLAKLRGRD